MTSRGNTYADAACFSHKDMLFAQRHAFRKKAGGVKALVEALATLGQSCTIATENFP